jgi:hypothetical protein
LPTTSTKPLRHGSHRRRAAAAVWKAGTYDAWHSAVVELRAEHLRASINRATVQDVDLAADPELRLRLKRGFIGLPDYGHAYTLCNIVIEDYGGTHKFVEPFDGRSLDGWRLRGAGNWAIRDGAIVGANGHSILYAPGTFRDFELSALVRSHNRVNAGIFLRGSPDEKQHRGFEVQIYSPVDSVYPTGSVYGYDRARVTADYEERWFNMQILVCSSECLVRVDGDTVARYDKLPPSLPSAGQIGLQIHMDGASLEFRDPRVRSLD